MRQMLKATPLLLGWLLLVTIGCEPSDPADQILKVRGQYTVKLNGIRADVPDLLVPETVPEAAAAAESAAVASEAAMAAEAEEGMAEEGEGEDEDGPRMANVLFDLIVRFEGSKPLPGITVELTHHDPFGEVKEERLHFVDTSSFAEGPKTQQFSFELDDFEYEEGDGFSLDYQAYVPPEERASYREFALSDP